MKKKSLNVKKAIPKSFNYSKILKDKKIYDIFQNFVTNFENLNNYNKIAISVSGGPDSMALCFLISCYKYTKNNIQPKFFLVDHGLRKESTIEALEVKKQLKLKKIKLKILKWRGKKPKSNLQKLARQKRYDLLFNECRKYNIKTLITGHHQDDLYETFFSRLLRGSGTDGLSSFAEVEKKFSYKRKIITVARPLLNIKKEDLTYIAQNFFNFYVDDPSNQMDKFQRVRLRKLISNLKMQGLDFNKLKLTINNLSSTNITINQIVNTNISENVLFYKNKYLIGSKFFLNPEEIVFRSLSKIIKKMSNKDYPPRGRKIINLAKELKNSDRLKATLGGTIIEKILNSVTVTKEIRKKR
tara:strand:- start:1407 stop:2474 length:1068 start_codon:yes stop_codon:yes gene_type:complete